MHWNVYFKMEFWENVAARISQWKAFSTVRTNLGLWDKKPVKIKLYKLKNEKIHSSEHWHMYLEMCILDKFSCTD